MYKLRLAVFIVSIFFAAGYTAIAQTPFSAPETSQQVTISKADMEAAMTPHERKELREFNEALRRHAEYGRSFEKGSKGRQGAVALFEQTKRERDEKFSHLKGLSGGTFIGYGMPPPTGEEVVILVMSQRLQGWGSQRLHPHYERKRDGSVVGLDKAPTYEDVAGDGIAAGPEVKVDGLSYGGSRTQDIDDRCGIVPNALKNSRKELKCVCTDDSTIMGIRSCNWRIKN